MTSDDAILAAAVGATSLMPIAASARRLGLRRTFSEPTAATIILLFYVAIFPQRALVIALDGYDNVLFAPERVTPMALAVTLTLAAVATTVLLESFHLVWNLRANAASETKSLPPDVGGDGRMVQLAVSVCAVTIGALLVIVAQSGGIAGATAVYAPHNKSIQGVTGPAGSIWSLFASPAMWSAAVVMANGRLLRPVRVGAAVVIALLITAQLVIFGSRLNVVIGLVGVWVVWHYAGHRVSTLAVAGAVVALCLVSIPILSARTGGETVGLPAHTRLSQTIGYSTLDLALAVRQRPGYLRERLRSPRRWTTFPRYLVPSFIDRSRPVIDSQLVDVYAAEIFGTRNQRATTGFPPGSIMEAWVIGGWFGVLVAAAAFGAIAGWLQARLVGRGAPSSADLLWSCVVVTAAFSYYKDGDLLAQAVGDYRLVLYLGILMYVFRVWTPLSRSGARSARSSVNVPLSPSVNP